MSTVDAGHAHLWTETSSPGTIRCAFQDCHARPSPADVERLRAEVEAARRMRYTIALRH